MWLPDGAYLPPPFIVFAASGKPTREPNELMVGKTGRLSLGGGLGNERVGFLL